MVVSQNGQSGVIVASPVTVEAVQDRGNVQSLYHSMEARIARENCRRQKCATPICVQVSAIYINSDPLSVLNFTVCQSA